MIRVLARYKIHVLKRPIGGNNQINITISVLDYDDAIENEKKIQQK